MVIIVRRDSGTKRGEWERKGEGIEKVGGSIGPGAVLSVPGVLSVF